MSVRMLYERFDDYVDDGIIQFDSIPTIVKDNINPKFKIREYQREAIGRFEYYVESFKNKRVPIHLLFNMATGSGKTLVMASNILYLYEKGYRNFIFFVNSTNIIKKTKENFLNNLSSKYLLSDKIVWNNREIIINEIDNFDDSIEDAINILFITIQGLHSRLYLPRENSITFEDFQ
ncbi:DEAD/DEAH box helicase family protein [Vallitalea guaymasensis]|uniref:DEAD/DEAH box helicase family protein n=1 Tax=Vallitalea guaymasensis TaxID=1185412 RepID=UPI000DE46162|nr:DEAD/DEAH box helicase family protein [Vallitalea guaymasensis]